MEYSRFLRCLAAGFARLRAVVPVGPAAAVPGCPGWAVADLTRHVGEARATKMVSLFNCLSQSRSAIHTIK